MFYLDTSVIIKLYFKEEGSAEAAEWVRKKKKAIIITDLHELELINAVNLKLYRNELTETDVSLFFSRFNKHENTGVLFRPQLDWINIFECAVNLSKKYTKNTGSRSLDILHIACAIILKSQRFLTFDDRQKKVAELAGLKIEKI